MLHCEILSFYTQEQSDHFKKIICYTKEMFHLCAPRCRNPLSSCPDFKRRICPTCVLKIKIKLKTYQPHVQKRTSSLT